MADAPWVELRIAFIQPLMVLPLPRSFFTVPTFRQFCTLALLLPIQPAMPPAPSSLPAAVPPEFLIMAETSPKLAQFWISEPWSATPTIPPIYMQVPVDVLSIIPVTVALL